MCALAQLTVQLCPTSNGHAGWHEHGQTLQDRRSVIAPFILSMMSMLVNTAFCEL